MLRVREEPNEALLYQTCECEEELQGERNRQAMRAFSSAGDQQHAIADGEW